MVADDLRWVAVSRRRGIWYFVTRSSHIIIASSYLMEDHNLHEWLWAGPGGGRWSVWWKSILSSSPHNYTTITTPHHTTTQPLQHHTTTPHHHTTPPHHNCTEILHSTMHHNRKVFSPNWNALHLYRCVFYCTQNHNNTYCNNQVYIFAADSYKTNVSYTCKVGCRMWGSVRETSASECRPHPMIRSAQASTHRSVMFPGWHYHVFFPLNLNNKS